jgi:hypothetical protein
MFKLVRQKTVDGCNQACFAMVFGIKFEDACKIYGHSHGTEFWKTRKIIRALGVKIDDKLVQLHGNPFPKKGTYFCRQHLGPHQNHLVVLRNGNIYDPGYGINPILHELFGWKYSSICRVYI